jgi:hypothetical protein
LAWIASKLAAVDEMRPMWPPGMTQRPWDTRPKPLDRRVWDAEHTRPGDLRVALSYLRDDAAQGFPSAVAMLAELDRLKRERALIRRGTVSVHGTHEWTGHRWRERG